MDVFGTPCTAADQIQVDDLSATAHGMECSVGGILVDHANEKD